MRSIPGTFNAYFMHVHLSHNFSHPEVQIRTILSYLDTNNVKVPNGGDLTPRRWLHLGMAFGMHGESLY
jgi:hypothetical protein